MIAMGGEGTDHFLAGSFCSPLPPFFLLLLRLVCVCDFLLSSRFPSHWPLFSASLTALKKGHPRAASPTFRFVCVSWLYNFRVWWPSFVREVIACHVLTWFFFFFLLQFFSIFCVWCVLLIFSIHFFSFLLLSGFTFTRRCDLTSQLLPFFFPFPSRFESKRRSVPAPPRSADKYEVQITLRSRNCCHLPFLIIELGGN